MIEPNPLQSLMSECLRRAQNYRKHAFDGPSLLLTPIEMAETYEYIAGRLMHIEIERLENGGQVIEKTVREAKGAVSRCDTVCGG